MTPEDALEKLKAGADLVQIYTGFIYEGPGFVKRINRALLQVK
jgi:dihydroorotate dehydrogenase